jgi:transposase
MTRRSRPNHSAAFKAKVALADVKNEHTLGELVQRVDVHPNQITTWKNQPLERAGGVFSRGEPALPAVDVKAPHAKIGQLTLERRDTNPNRHS